MALTVDVLEERQFGAALPLALAAIALAPESPTPIYEQIERAIRSAIQQGDLPTGTLLPTSRELAQALGVGRNTVVAAYSRLTAEGFLISKFRRGTRVAQPPVGVSLAAASPESPVREEPDDRASLAPGFQAQRAFQRWNSHGAVAHPFSEADPSLFPRAALQRLLSDAFGRFEESGSLGDCRHFQEAVAAHFRQARGVVCVPEQVIPVSSSLACFDLVGRVLLDPGHATLVEDPAPRDVCSAFEAAGARVFSLPVDSAGADPRAAKTPPPRLIYVSPSLNVPAGPQMTLERRVALLEAARAWDSAVLEWDGLSELLFAGSRIGALQGLDTEGRVLYCGSFECTLGPHLTAAFLVVPENLGTTFMAAARSAGQVPHAFLLAAIAAYLESNQYAMHVKRLRAAYARRVKLAADALREALPHAVIVEPLGGLQLTVALPPNIDAGRAAQQARDCGFAAALFDRYSLARPAPNRLVLGLAGLPDRLVDVSSRRFAATLTRP